MKDLFSMIKFITILGLGAILLLGCVREQPKPVARESTKRSHISSDGNYWIDPISGAAIDLREVKKDGKKKSCYLQANSLPAQDRQKYLKECLP